MDFADWNDAQLLEDRKHIEAACEALSALNDNWVINGDALVVLWDLQRAVERLRLMDERAERRRLETWRTAAQAAA